MNEVFEKVVIATIGGIIGAVIIKKIEEKKRNKEEETFGQKIKRADEILEDCEWRLKADSELANNAIIDLSRKVDAAVKSVYDGEAKAGFKRKLDDYDFKSIAIKECKESMQDITDSELRKLIYAKYSAQVCTVLGEEIRKYFKENVTDVVKTTLDENYIQRTARSFIKDEVVGILEDRADKAISSCDVDDIVKDYLKERSVKLESIIRKTVTKLVSEKVDDLDLEVDDEPTNGIHITFG
jgi:hypothetical protein